MLEVGLPAAISLYLGRVAHRVVTKRGLDNDSVRGLILGLSDFLGFEIVIPETETPSFRRYIGELAFSPEDAMDALALGIGFVFITSGEDTSLFPVYVPLWLVDAASQRDAEEVVKQHGRRQALIRNQTQKGTFQKALVIAYERAMTYALNRIKDRDFPRRCGV